jgi:hypothetical protein
VVISNVAWILSKVVKVLDNREDVYVIFK